VLKSFASSIIRMSKLGFGAQGAEGDPKPQMFILGFGAQGAEGDPKPQMFKQVSRLPVDSVSCQRS
jgi:hypothetical protein